MSTVEPDAIPPLGSAAAEAARPPDVDPARGTNQNGVRLCNERLVLSLIRKKGSLPKAEIARQRSSRRKQSR
jgi:hypothetical protein